MMDQIGSNKSVDVQAKFIKIIANLYFTTESVQALFEGTGFLEGMLMRVVRNDPNSICYVLCILKLAFQKYDVDRHLPLISSNYDKLVGSLIGLLGCDRLNETHCNYVAYIVKQMLDMSGNPDDVVK